MRRDRSQTKNENPHRQIPPQLAARQLLLLSPHRSTNGSGTERPHTGAHLSGTLKCAAAYRQAPGCQTAGTVFLRTRRCSGLLLILLSFVRLASR